MQFLSTIVWNLKTYKTKHFRGSVDSSAPTVPGSNPKHTIYAFSIKSHIMY